MVSDQCLFIEACLTKCGPMTLSGLAQLTDLSEQWLRYLLLLHNDIFAPSYQDADNLIKLWRVIPPDEREQYEHEDGLSDE